MKRIFLILFFLITSSGFCFSQSSDQRLGELINSSDFFTLKKEYPKLEENASEFIQLFSASMINSYFNKPSEAINAINKLVTIYASQMGIENYISLVVLMADNFTKLNDWESAASIFEQLLSQTSQYLDENRLNNFNRYLKEECIPLKSLPKFEVDKTKTYSIPFKRDALNYITLPTVINNHELDFVLDFGAGISLLHEKYAKGLDIEYITDSIYIPGLNGEQIYSKLGIAKEVQLGDMMLYNVPFYITSEPIVKDLPIEYEMKGIIGLSVFNNLKNLTFQKEKKLLVINSNSIKEPLESNMILFNHVLIVKCNHDNDTLLMKFDTGAKETILLDSYYQKYKNKKDEWEKTTSIIGGFSSSKEYEIYNQKNFNLEVGTQKFRLDNIKIVLGDKIENAFILDGYLGIDLFEKSDEMIIDFENMYINYLK